jgi:predicted membrane protein
MVSRTTFNVIVILFLVFGFAANLSESFFGLGYILALAYLSFIFIWLMKEKSEMAPIIAGFSLASAIAEVTFARFNAKLFIDAILFLIMSYFIYEERKNNPPKKGMWDDFR